MRIMRSKGTSYTRFEGRLEKLTESSPEGPEVGRATTAPKPRPSRGLLLKRPDKLMYSENNEATWVWGSDVLPDEIELDRDLTLRRLVQWLDKVLKKPRTLKRFDLDSYVARTHLGECLWDIFKNKPFKKPLEDADLHVYRTRWAAKVHPYARHEISWDEPEKDGNAKEIEAYRIHPSKRSATPFFSKTSWTDVFKVPIGEFSRARYLAAAEAIEHHLGVQELMINGKARKDEGRPTGYGLIYKHGDILTQSASDPRCKDTHERHLRWSEETEDLYFEPGDVAKKIASDFKSAPKRGRPRQRIGEALYEHFGVILIRNDILDQSRTDLWILHNRIRLYYRRIVESARFLQAASAGDIRKLEFLLPRDAEELLERVRGKKQTSQINRLMRLGKVIAHSVDLCAGSPPETFDPMVRAAMDYYVTSIGQADIKRSEAFVRVLRTSVAFSSRTHAAWLDKGLDIYLSKSAVARTAENRDLASKNVAAGALTHLPIEQIKGHGQVIFGARAHRIQLGRAGGDGEAQEGDRSRTDLLFDGSGNDREVLWGLLRLAGRIRDRSYHFNTKKRLLATLKTGLLQPAKPGQQLSPFDTRAGNTISAAGVERLEALLDYDFQLDATILSDELNRLRFARHVPSHRRSSALAVLRRLPASDDRVTPKFMTVLQKAKGLASVDDAGNVPELLRPFAKLSLHDLSKDAGSVNHDRLGLLRLLYNRGFPNWLEKVEGDGVFAKEIFSEILKNKKIRRAEYVRGTKKALIDDEAMAETLLGEVDTLSKLEGLFEAEALVSVGEPPDDTRLLDEDFTPTDPDGKPSTFSAPKNPYVQDRTQQVERASALQALRREVYAYLFARFLAAEGFDWIWLMDEPRAEHPEEGGRRVRAVTYRELSNGDITHEPWLRQFYAWLYLVPVDQIALLQHQFRKTAILERKGAEERRKLLLTPRPTGLAASVLDLVAEETVTPDELRALDRIMGLYTRVQSAGFSGTEQPIGRELYIGKNSFDDLFQQEAPDADRMLPGTRAGLRQLARFGTLNVLRVIFEKHRVTLEEVGKLRKLIEDKDLALFHKKQELHAQIVAEHRKEVPDGARMKEDVQLYRALTAEVCTYNFAISAARLSEFANLHHLLINILGRLADFAAIWERDRDCVLLALTYEANPDMTFVRVSAQSVGLKGPDMQKPVEIYGRGDGFALMHRKPELLALAMPRDGMERPEKAWVQRYFGLPPTAPRFREEHKKDVAFRERRNPELRREGKVELEPNIGHRFQVWQIRNDLAHFNVLDRTPDLNEPGQYIDRKGINLTYLINAVRGLLSYDRKMKNAVPKAIADILQRQGMAIRWSFSRDRLGAAQLYPVFQPHLDFLRSEDLASFSLPRVSPRQLSMTRALFDFGTSGYLVDVEGREGVKELAYPLHALEACKANGVPDMVLQPLELASELRK